MNEGLGATLELLELESVGLRGTEPERCVTLKSVGARAWGVIFAKLPESLHIF